MAVRSLKEFFGNVAVWLFNSAGLEVKAFAEDDGTIRVQLVGWDGAQERIKNEASGELAVSHYGKFGANVTAFKVESTGEQDMVLHGLDEASNIDALRTDPDQILWTRNRPVWIDIDPVEVPSTEGDLWDPGGLASTITYEVEFNVINNDAGGAAVTVSVGLDLASGASLAAPEYWMFNEVIPYPGSSGWRGPFIMHGDDQVRGIASAANDASCHFRVKRVDTGA